MISEAKIVQKSHRNTGKLYREHYWQEYLTAHYWQDKTHATFPYCTLFLALQISKELVLLDTLFGAVKTILEEYVWKHAGHWNHEHN